MTAHVPRHGVDCDVCHPVMFYVTLFGLLIGVPILALLLGETLARWM